METASIPDTDRSRRSLVLRSMAWFGNAYLIAFAADGLRSVAELAVLGPQRHDPTLHPASYPGHVLGLSVFLASALLPFLLLFVPQLPRLPFVPPLGYVAIGTVLTLLLGASPDLVAWLSITQPLVA